MNTGGARNRATTFSPKPSRLFVRFTASVGTHPVSMISKTADDVAAYSQVLNTLIASALWLGFLTFGFVENFLLPNIGNL